MQLGFDLSELSTKIALLVLFGVAIGGLFIAFGNTEGAIAFMGLISTGAGIIGAAVREKKKVEVGNEEGHF